MTESEKVDAAIAAQQQARLDEPVLSLAHRQGLLLRLKQMLARNADDLADAMDCDFGGRDCTFSKMNDILACILSLDASAKGMGKWSKPQRRSAPVPFSLFGARSDVTYEPRGVIGIIGSWNAPLYTLIAPLSSAIAAGNRAILKPSELVPMTGTLFARLIGEAFDPSELTVLTGDAATARALVSGNVDMIVFTGGSGTGRKVLQQAAEQLTPVILELGGKSPVVVSRTADLGLAAHRIALGKGANSGQLCVAPDTIHVPLENVKEFSDLLLQNYEQQFGAMGATAALASAEHKARFDRLIDDAKAQGAQVKTLAAQPDGTRRSAFSVVMDPPEMARIAQEEIFGPAALVFGYSTFDQLIARLQRQARPLALYYFGSDRHEEAQLLERVPSGGVTINDVLMHASAFDAPFGGTGASGMGCYHGREGFEAMSHCRTVFRAGWWDPRKALGLLPPYTQNMRQMIDRTVKRAAG